jgi:hypothetical protein
MIRLMDSAIGAVWIPWPVSNWLYNSNLGSQRLLDGCLMINRASSHCAWATGPPGLATIVHF